MLDAEKENQIPPPKNPATIKINLFVLKTYFDWFCKKFLPAFMPEVTSEYRTPEHNAEVGGALNSAHVHGLARDFILKDAQGNKLPELQARNVYEKFIVPNWLGWTEFESSSAAEGWHIHVNISRVISQAAGLITLAGGGLLITLLIKQFTEGNKNGNS